MIQNSRNSNPLVHETPKFSEHDVSEGVLFSILNIYIASN